MARTLTCMATKTKVKIRPAYIAATRSIRTTDGVTCPIRTGFRPHQFIVRMIAVTGTIAIWGIAARPTSKRRLSAKPPRRRDDPRFHQISGLSHFLQRIGYLKPSGRSLRSQSMNDDDRKC